MVERKGVEIIHELRNNMQDLGLQIEHYCAYKGVTIDSLREQYRASAGSSVKLDLFLEAVAKAEAVTLSPEDIDAEFELLAGQYGRDINELKIGLLQSGNFERFVDSLNSEKAVEFVLRANGFPVPDKKTAAVADEADAAEAIDATEETDAELVTDTTAPTGEGEE
jgi:trigger factor